MIDSIRRYVREWRARRALTRYQHFTRRASRAAARYAALRSIAEPVGRAAPFAIAATAFVIEAPAAPIVQRVCEALVPAGVSITTLRGRSRGRHAAPTTRRAPKQPAPVRDTTRPVGAHRKAETAPRSGPRRLAIGDFTLGGRVRPIRRHYAARSWGFDGHKLSFWPTEDGWATA